MVNEARIPAHVTPRRAGGATTRDHLALACVSCSLREGAKESATDPDAGALAPRVNPRKQVRA